MQVEGFGMEGENYGEGKVCKNKNRMLNIGTIGTLTMGKRP